MDDPNNKSALTAAVTARIWQLLLLANHHQAVMMSLCTNVRCVFIIIVQMNGFHGYVSCDNVCLSANYAKWLTVSSVDGKCSKGCVVGDGFNYIWLASVDRLTSLGHHLVFPEWRLQVVLIVCRLIKTVYTYFSLWVLCAKLWQLIRWSTD